MIVAACAGERQGLERHPGEAAADIFVGGWGLTNPARAGPATYKNTAGDRRVQRKARPAAQKSQKIR